MAQKYDKQLKACVVYDICELRKSTSKTAQEYGIPVKTVENWITEYNKNPRVYETVKLTNDEKIKELEKEIKDLKKANEILKKTLVFFAKKE